MLLLQYIYRKRCYNHQVLQPVKQKMAWTLLDVHLYVWVLEMAYVKTELLINGNYFTAFQLLLHMLIINPNEKPLMIHDPTLNKVHQQMKQLLSACYFMVLVVYLCTVDIFHDNTTFIITICIIIYNINEYFIPCIDVLYNEFHREYMNISFTSCWIMVVNHVMMLIVLHLPICQAVQLLPACESLTNHTIIPLTMVVFAVMMCCDHIAYRRNIERQVILSNMSFMVNSAMECHFKCKSIKCHVGMIDPWILWTKQCMKKEDVIAIFHCLSAEIWTGNDDQLQFSSYVAMLALLMVLFPEYIAESLVSQGIRTILDIDITPSMVAKEGKL